MSDGEYEDYMIEVPLPAGVVPQHSVTVVAYFDAEGSTRYGINMRGEASLASILGLLELAKRDVIRDSESW